MSIQKGIRPEIQHPSVGVLLAAYPGESDAEQLIKRLARDKVAYARKFGWGGPPFCPFKFVSIFRIHCNEVSHDIGGDGRILLNRKGRPVIEYRSGRLPERQRFTVFHEFAHMLFPDYCEFLPHHYTPGEIESLEHKQFEHICDVGATEMLLPVEEFTSEIKAFGQPRFKEIELLRKRYHASIDATIHRLIELGNHIRCSAAFLTDQKGKHDGDGPLWVKYSKKTSRFNGFIWPGTCPPKTSVAIQCYTDGKTLSMPVREVWSVKGKACVFFVQAARLPVISDNVEYSKVVVLLYPTS